ncbi:MAG: tyrosine-type recombinase/integrase [Candidatus Rokubacteria bacterium]|nr:tyrosine-type recombinase/integrase [Candidatus Rokubacteria bacterium]
MARGSIVRRGRSYSIVYYVDGRQRWKSLGAVKRKEAERHLRQILNEIQDGTFRDLKPTSFREYANQWLEFHRANVKPATYDSYKSVVNGHLVPRFGDHALSAIARPSLRQFTADLLESGRSAKTARNVLTILHKILEDALEDGYLRSNPAHKFRKPKVSIERVDFPTPQEVHHFLNHVSPAMYPLFLTAIMTGMRRGEILGLQRGDIDWHSGQIHVRRTLYKRRFVTPKSRKGLRAIDMAPTVAHTLQGHLLKVADVPDALVFPARRGKPMDPDNLIKREFQPALVRAELRQIRFHDLRHTYASLLINNGENIKYIAEQMGHASVQITLDRYGHLFPSVRREAVLRLEKSLFPPKAEPVVNAKDDVEAKPDEPGRQRVVEEELAEWKLGGEGGAQESSPAAP